MLTISAIPVHIDALPRQRQQSDDVVHASGATTQTNVNDRRPATAFARIEKAAEPGAEGGAVAARTVQAPAAAYIAQVVAQAYALNESNVAQLPRGAYVSIARGRQRVIALV